VRKDFLHKLSTRICKNHARVYVEGLHIKNMSSSARGTIDDPGTKVKAKSGLNKSILDQGWFEFRRQLDYKLLWEGGMLVEVDFRYTSQTCSCCGYRSKENRQSQAVFRCLACGHEENADVNAAKNILTVGQTGMACDLKRRYLRNRIALAVGSRNLQETARKYCSGLVKAHGIPLLKGWEDVKIAMSNSKSCFPSAHVSPVLS
jgi:IS605 OrfB family transposase